MKKHLKSKFILPLLSMTLLSGAVTGCNSSTANAYFECKEKNVQMECFEEHELLCTYKGITAEDVTWSSNANSVATIDDGLVTSVGIGRATITGQYNNYTYTCNILVTKSTSGRALIVSDQEITLDFGLGEEKDVSAYLKENGEVKQANIVWESSNTKVVTVNENGHIVPVGRGTAIVSAFCIYKGQKFKKSITVKSVSLSSKAVTLSLLDNDGSTLTSYDDSTTGYFEGAKESYQYNSKGGFTSRVFANDSIVDGKAANDRLIFQIKFNEAPTCNLRYALGNKNRALKANTSLMTNSSDFLIYDYKGRIADYVRVAKNYYVVANLNNIVAGDDFGFYFELPTNCYLSTAFLCSDDYLFETMGFEKPYELPKLNYVVADTQSGLPLGDHPIDGIDEYWILHASGSDTWTDNVWNERVTIGGISYSDYRKFNYEYMDIMFTNADFAQMLIWTGGYSIRIDSSFNLTSTETLSFKDDDLAIFIGDEEVAQGTKLQANVNYTFKIRVQKDNLENVAFGISVVSSHLDDIYLSRPSFNLI